MSLIYDRLGVLWNIQEFFDLLKLKTTLSSRNYVQTTTIPFTFESIYNIFAVLQSFVIISDLDLKKKSL